MIKADRLEILKEIDKLERKHCKSCELIEGADQSINICKSKCKEIYPQIRALGDLLIKNERGPVKPKPQNKTKEKLITKEQYLHLKNEGLSDAGIARKLKISTNTIVLRKREWGLTAQTKKEKEIGYDDAVAEACKRLSINDAMLKNTMQLIYQKYTYQDMADELDKSLATMEKRAGRIFKHTGIRNRKALFKFMNDVRREMEEEKCTKV